ncbi:hypothetical protein [Serratia fonticola]|uniref:hypothetical protein n=1 Tax=Serratia fonticola TaxID=47917 RepID=UPI00192BFFD6|nr:hypothetical protein [Serratia fonticola]MBL5906431.1 hypothetical protein [Serratia fonticola]
MKTPLTFADVQNKTIISTAFSDAEKAAILEAMRFAYEKSQIAKDMFDDWIGVSSNTISIAKGLEFSAYANRGKVEVNLDSLATAMYIDNYGTAVLRSAAINPPRSLW